MFECENSGCPAVFNSEHGVLVHMRACVLSSTMRESRWGGLYDPSYDSLNPPQIGGHGKRLALDNAMLADMGNYWMTEAELNRQADQHQVRVDAMIGQDGGQVLSEGETLSTGVEERRKAKEAVDTVQVLLVEISRKTGSSDVDKLIRMVTGPLFNLDLFKKESMNLSQCKEVVAKRFNKKISIEGFAKKETITSQGFSYSFHSRCPVSVLKRQFMNADESDILFRPVKLQNEEGEPAICGPMSTAASHRAAASVREAVKRSHDLRSVWHAGNRHDGESSFVGMGMMYTDKSYTSLNVASAVRFYPLHLTVLNFTEEHRRRCIVRGDTIVGYLPTELFNMEEDIVFGSSMRPIQMGALHDAISTILQPLKDLAEEGFVFRSRRGEGRGILRRCHFCMFSYCADLPEAKDICCVLHGARCHRCYVHWSDMNITSNSYPRLLPEILRSQDEVRTGLKRSARLREQGYKSEATKVKNIALGLMKDLSVSTTTPFLSSFPFVGIDSSLEMTSLFVFEPLHNLHLGVSKLLKLCASRRLSSKELKSASMKNSKNESRSFNLIRASVLNEANMLLARFERESPARGLHVDFSTPGKGNHYNGLFKSEGLTGMLEAKDYRSLDMVFPFIGALFDRCCGEVSHAPTTNLFVMYTELVRLCYRYGKTPLWTESEVGALGDFVSKFKAQTVKLYGQHHDTELRTLKFHMLDHLKDDVERMGGIQFGDAGLFENSHRIFKQKYRSTSRRKEAAVRETLDLLDWSSQASIALSESQVLSHRCGPTRDSGAFRKIKKSRKESVHTDMACLVRDGELVSVADLMTTRHTRRRLRKSIEKKSHDLNEWKQKMRQQNDTCVEIVDTLEEDGTLMFVRTLLRWHGLKQGDENLHDIKFLKVKSGYVAGHPCPDMTQYDSNAKTVSLKENVERISQRFVASKSFHNGRYPRHDCVLIDGEREESGRREIWIGKVLLLVRAKNFKRFDTTQAKSDKAKDTCVSSESDRELVFVQFFEFVNPKDEVDHALGCVKLEWARQQEETGEGDGDKIIRRTRVEKSQGRWFGLIPVTAIRGVVHVIRATSWLHESRKWRDGQRSRKHYWELDTFYVNRFYTDPQQILYKAGYLSEDGSDADDRPDISDEKSDRGFEL